MSASALQLVALVGHGNAYLSEPAGTPAPELLGTNSTFKHVAEITFSRRNRRLDGAGKLVATGTAEWFELLRKEHALRLRFAAPAWNNAERKIAGFANSVSEAIQVTYRGRFEIWHPFWDTAIGSGWKVRYRGQDSRTPIAITEIHLDEARSSLLQAIASVESFARRKDVSEDYWADRFAKALVQLDSPSPQGAFYPHVFPEAGYGLAAKQIVAACQQADVFGGMGSWNEVSFKDKGLQNEYEKLSAELYEAIKLGYITAANSFAIEQ